jgi:arabinose-5-phosphate isomerase
MHTNSAVHGDLGLVGEKDLVILLTKSGETEESEHLTGFLKKKKCKLWLLSFNRQSTLYNQIPNRLIIDLEHEGDEWNILPNNSTLLNLIVLQELAMLIAKKREIPIDVLRENHPGGAIGITLSERETHRRSVRRSSRRGNKDLNSRKKNIWKQ